MLRISIALSSGYIMSVQKAAAGRFFYVQTLRAGRYAAVCAMRADAAATRLK